MKKDENEGKSIIKGSGFLGVNWGDENGTIWVNVGDGNFSNGNDLTVSDREATGNNDNNQQESDPPPKRNYSFGNGSFKVNYTVSNMYQDIKVYQLKK